MNRAQAAEIARAARAKNVPPLQIRFWSKVDVRRGNECWPWVAAMRNKSEGYGAFWLDGRHQPSNRVALLLSGIKVADGMVCCHRCDNPSCCNPAHIFVGTPKQNNDDKLKKDRDCKGSKSPNAKLTESDVAFIRSFKPAGVKRMKSGLPAQLAEQFGITKQYVSEVCATGWRHV
jgi:hypothetical protein